MNLLILACSQRKRATAGLLPAVARYDGPAYRILRRWMRCCPRWQERLHVQILSARYGLIGLHTDIPRYDQRMDRETASALRPQVSECLRVIARADYHSVFVSVGQAYRAALPDHLPFAAVQWASGGIGVRNRQLKEWLECEIEQTQ